MPHQTHCHPSSHLVHCPQSYKNLPTPSPPRPHLFAPTPLNFSPLQTPTQLQRFSCPLLIASMSSMATFDESIAWLDSILEVQDACNGFLTAAPPSERLLSPQGPSFGYPSPLCGDQHSPYIPTRSVDSPSSSATSHSQSSSTQPSAADSSLAGPSSTLAPTAKPPRRRIRPKIALDPSQPLTARGKQRARVYVACDQWCVKQDRISTILPTASASAAYMLTSGPDILQSYPQNSLRRRQARVFQL